MSKSLDLEIAHNVDALLNNIKIHYSATAFVMYFNLFFILILLFSDRFHFYYSTSLHMHAAVTDYAAFFYQDKNPH